MTVTLNFETLIWAPVAVGLVIVLVGAIWINLSRPRHEDVDALAAQRLQADRERAREVNAAESQRAAAKEKLWLHRIDNHVL